MGKPLDKAPVYASSPILSGRVSVATTASMHKLPKAGQDTASGRD